MAEQLEHQIAVIDYPGAQQSAIHGLIDLFETANRLNPARDAGASRFSVLRLPADDCRGEYQCGLLALILPPCLTGTVEKGALATLKEWIRARHCEGTIACSVCAGAFILADADLLDDRPATTHWVLAQRFALEFPKVKLDQDKMLVDDGDVLTAGGVMAWTDLGLRLIERWMGKPAMLATARMFLIDPGGREQRFYSSLEPQLAHADAGIVKVQNWLALHYARSVRINTLANLAGLGERTFLRRFQSATGQSPNRYLQQLRVARAKEQLALDERPIDAIAESVGYADVSAFRKIFQRTVGLTPGAYRQRFSVARGSALVPREFQR